jgi:DNA topoisomerase-3
METAGKAIEDEALRAAMKDTGLGTPATRAATIETLIRRGFILRAGKNVQATDTGVALIQALPVQSLASPELTGSWEARLARIARGAEARTRFMQDIASYVTEVVGAIRAAPVSAVMPSASGPPRGRGGGRARDGGGHERRTRAPQAASRPATARAPSPRPSSGDPAALTCPRCKQGTLLAGKRGWGCTRWREGCTFVVWFEVAGKRLTDSQLRELVEKGRTRKAQWPGQGGPISGRLILDLDADRDRGAARLELE